MQSAPLTTNPETTSGLSRTTSELVEALAALKAAGPVGPSSRTVEWLPANRIEELPTLFQPRAIDEKHVSDLVRAIRDQAEIEPLAVLRVGGRNIVIDGHHRLAAYRLAKGNRKVPVRFFGGTVEEAVLEAGKANSKVKLPMSLAERMDYGWRLVVIDTFSKAQIREAAAISDGQVAEMRRVRKHLGDEAALMGSWREAKVAAKGTQIEMSDDQRQLWKEQRAEDYADKLSKTFSTRLTRDPEIAAMALATYFGRRLPEVWRELREFIGDDDQIAEDEAYGDF